MDFTNDFFIQAQGVIERVFRAERETLVAANGNIQNELKSDKTPVTVLDKAVEEKLRTALKQFDASIGIEGEELGIEGSRETFWLIDPIDGTEAFIRGGARFRNVVTLIDRGRPYFTLIYKPVPDELYVAAEGEGAFLNGRAIHMKERPLKQARIAVHAPGKKPEVWELLKRLAPHVNAIETYTDFVSIARGEADALLSYKGGGGPWDFAPRALLIQEAGARVTNLGSQTYDYTINDMLAAHPAIFDELMQIITEHTRT